MAVKKRKPTFVLVIPRFEDIFHSFYAGEIIRGVSFSASRLNIDFLVHIVDRQDHGSWLDQSLLDRNYVDGVIFADIDNDIGVVKKVIQNRLSCIVLNNILSEPINYIAIDNYKAAFQIVEFLIEQGHKHIATIAGDVSTQAGLMRLEGYRDAMTKHKIEVPRTYVTFGDFLRTPARKAAQKLLKLKNRPTAIFSASDVMAMELIDAAKQMDLRVPGDISVFGFDDNPIVSTGSVKLSTVAQPIVEMGRLGAENLYLISRGKAKLPVKITLPTHMVKRASTAKLGSQ